PVLVGDWDGDGDDSLAVRRGATFHLRNTLGSGPADREVVYGRSGDAAFAGDWNGDGTDTLGVRRGSCNILASTTANTSSGSNPFLNLSTIVGSTMRVADERCYERVELEFRGAGPVPGWQAGYVDVIRSDGSGDPIQPPLEGVASLQVTYGAWNTGEPAGQPPFSGPSRIVTSGYDALREARSVSGFEGISDLGIGLDRVRPYMVQWSVDPARGTTRLVVYIYTGSGDEPVRAAPMRACRRRPERACTRARDTGRRERPRAQPGSTTRSGAQALAPTTAGATARGTPTNSRGAGSSPPSRPPPPPSSRATTSAAAATTCAPPSLAAASAVAARRSTRSPGRRVRAT